MYVYVRSESIRWGGEGETSCTVLLRVTDSGLSLTLSFHLLHQIETRKAAKGQKQGTRGPGININPEQLGLPPGFSLEGNDEITWEWDDDEEDEGMMDGENPAEIEAEIEGFFNSPSFNR